MSLEGLRSFGAFYDHKTLSISLYTLCNDSVPLSEIFDFRVKYQTQKVSE